MSALRAYISKWPGEIFSYYRILISSIRCNLWQSLNKFCTSQEYRGTLNFRKFKVALNPMYRIDVIIVV